MPFFKYGNLPGSFGQPPQTSFERLRSGVIQAGELIMQGADSRLRSANFNNSDAGWIIRGDGSASFLNIIAKNGVIGNLTVSGDLTLDGGEFTTGLAGTRRLRIRENLEGRIEWYDASDVSMASIHVENVGDTLDISSEEGVIVFAGKAGASALRLGAIGTLSDVDITASNDINLSPVNDIFAFAHFLPNSDNTKDLGNSTVSWRNLYAWNIKDEGGTTRIDLNLMRFTGHIDPVTNAIYDLGDAVLSWRDLYVHTLKDEAGAQVLDMNVCRFHKHVDPGGDNTYDLGDSALTWRRLYVYDIYDEAGVRRIQTRGASGLLMYGENSTLQFNVASGKCTFHDEFFGTSAWTATASSSHKAVVWDASTFQFYRFTSRRSMKKNIVDMDPAMSDGLHDLQVRTFDVRKKYQSGQDFADFNQHGLIADEVHAVYGDQAAAPGEDGEPDGWSSTYMTVMLIGEVQKAKKERVVLEARIAALEARL